MNIKTLIQRPFRYSQVNAAFVIIGINLLAHLIFNARPSLVQYFAMNPVLVLRYGMFWQVFTYQFVHGSISHVVFNMLGIFFFGISLERKIGSKEFLLLYLLCGTLSGIISLAIYAASGAYGIFLMGASGSLFALLLTYAVLFPRSIIYIWGLVPIPAPLLVLGYAAIEVFNIFTGSTQGIAHITHIAGFAVAWVYCLLRFNLNPIQVWSKR